MTRSRTAPRTRLEAPDLGLLVVALAGLAGSLTVLVRHAPEASAGWGRGGAVLLLVAAPFAWRPVDAALARLVHRPRVRGTLGALVALALLAAAGRDAPLSAVLVLGTGVALELALRTGAGGAGVVVIALGVVQGLGVLELAPGPAALLVGLAACGAGAGALVLLHPRLARAPARAGWIRMHRADPGRPARRGPRIGYALRAGAGVLLVAIVLYPWLMFLPSVLESRPWARGGDPDERSEPDEDPGRSFEEASRRLGPITSSLDYQGQIAPLSEDEVMVVRPLAGGVDPAGRPLYLRGMVMDTFTPYETRLGSPEVPPLLADGADGELDGWTRLGPPPAAARRLELEIRQHRLILEPAGWAILFGVQPVRAVSLPQVRFDPDGIFVAPDVETDAGDWHVYRVVGEAPLGLDAVAAGASARSPDPRHSQLPPQSPDLAWLADYSVRVTRGARTDVERVRRLVRHFRSEFDYTLRETRFAGVVGLVEFVRRREGYCSQFAAATALCLRTLGLSARVATGFLASEYDPAAGTYRVLGRNAHAWVEVWFEGAGWVTVEPTASDRVAEAFERGHAGGPPGLRDWYRDFVAQVRSFGSDLADLSDVLAELGRAPAALFQSLGRRPTLLAALLLVPLAALLVRRRRSPGRGTGTPAGEASVARTWTERLLEGLAARGWRRRPGQTLRELGRAAVAVETDLAELPAVIERLYAWRFGRTRPADEELETVERFVAGLGRTRGAKATAAPDA